MENLPENNPALKSFIEVKAHSHFPIQNLPFGIFQLKTDKTPRAGVAIGDMILDLKEITQAGLFNGPLLSQQKVFCSPTLNAFLSLGKTAWREARSTISQLLRHDVALLRDNKQLRQKALHHKDEVIMLLPIQVTSFTDFYSSKQHASNIGIMFRDKNNPLLPNWLHLPIGYDARASTIVVSGTNFRRPRGQIQPNTQATPVFAQSQQLDIEIEVAFIIGTGNDFGAPITVDQAPSHVFGVVLLCDWSARDIQRWEYVPLGPFLGKNFCTSISPWIVTLDALEPFRTKGCNQEPLPLPYLNSTRNWAYDINLEFLLQTPSLSAPHSISLTNYRNIYWDFCQQLAHHTSNGCKMLSGDIFASGTISGNNPQEYGSLLEITWGGINPINLPNQEKRTFLLDGDKSIINGWCQGPGYQVGFGEVSGTVLPSIKDTIKQL